MNKFIIEIKYQDKKLTYTSFKDKLLLEDNNYTNIELMFNRALEILEFNNWNEEKFEDLKQ